MANTNDVATLTVGFEPRISDITDALDKIENSHPVKVKFEINDSDINSKLDKIVGTFQDKFKSAFSNINLDGAVKSAGSAVKAEINSWKSELSGLQDKVQSIFNKAGFNQNTLGSKFSGIANTAEYANAIKIMQQLSKMDTGKIVDRKQFADYKKAVVDASQALNALIAKQREFNDSVSRAKAIDSLTNKLNGLREQAQKAGKTNELNAFIERLKLASKDGSISIEQLRKEISEFSADLLRSGGSLTSFSQVFQGIFGVSLAQTVRRALTQFAKAVVSSVKEVNTALTNFQIVAGVSEKKLGEFTKGAFAASQRVSASFSDIADAATVFRRLGYSADDSLQMSEITTMFSKLGDINVSDAEDAATAVLKAFDMTSNDLQLAMDKMVKVGNNFPISAAQIGEALNNASSALAAGGNNFDQSIALLTAANATVQDASKTSTALRTITARIRNTKVELEDLGEQVDETYNTTAKYRKELKALSGVDILDANDAFKSTFDILSELAAVWDTLGSEEKAAITTMVAGTRGLNVFSSLMENFDTAKDVMDAVGDAAGFMEEKYETYTSSIEAANNRLKNSWDELANNILNSDLVVGAVDLLGSFLDKINDASDWIKEHTSSDDDFNKPQTFDERRSRAEEYLTEIKELQDQITETSKSIQNLEKKKEDGTFTEQTEKEIANLKAESIELNNQIVLLQQKYALASQALTPSAVGLVSSNKFTYVDADRREYTAYEKRMGIFHNAPEDVESITKTGTLTDAIENNIDTINTAQGEMDYLNTAVNTNAITFEEYSAKMVAWMMIQQEAAEALSGTMTQLESAIPYLTGSWKTIAEQSLSKAQATYSHSLDKTAEIYDTYGSNLLREQLVGNLLDAYKTKNGYEAKQIKSDYNGIGDLRKSEYAGQKVTEEIVNNAFGGNWSSPVLSNKTVLPNELFAMQKMTDSGTAPQREEKVDLGDEWSHRALGVAAHYDEYNDANLMATEGYKKLYNEWAMAGLGYSDQELRQAVLKEYKKQLGDTGYKASVAPTPGEALWDAENQLDIPSVQDLGDALSTFVTDTLPNAIDGLDSAISSNVDGFVTDTLPNAIDGLDSAISTAVGGFITDTLPNAIDGFDSAISTAVGGFITDTLPNTIDGLDSAISDAVDGFVTDTLPNTIDGLDSAIPDAVETFVTDELPNAVDGITWWDIYKKATANQTYYDEEGQAHNVAEESVVDQNLLAQQQADAELRNAKKAATKQAEIEARDIAWSLEELNKEIGYVSVAALNSEGIVDRAYSDDWIKFQGYNNAGEYLDFLNSELERLTQSQADHNEAIATIKDAESIEEVAQAVSDAGVEATEALEKVGVSVAKEKTYPSIGDLQQEYYKDKDIYKDYYEPQLRGFVESLSEEEIGIATHWVWDVKSGKDPVEDLKDFIAQAQESVDEAGGVIIKVDTVAASQDLTKLSNTEKAINAAVSGQISRGYLTLDEVNALGPKYESALTYAFGRTNIDAEKAYAIQRQEQQDVYNKASMTLLAIQTQIVAKQKQIEKIQSENVDHADELVAKHKADVAELEKQRTEMRLIMDATSEQMSTRTAFQTALGTPNGSTNVDSMRDNLKDTFEKARKYGMVGTDDFRTAIDYVLGEGEHAYDPKEAALAEKRVKAYSADKGRGRKAVLDKLFEGGENGALIQHEKGGGYSIKDGVTVQDMADKLKISKDYMYDLLHMMTDYGDKFDFSDEYVTDFVEGAETVEQKYAAIATASAKGQDPQKVAESIKNQAASVEDLAAAYAYQRDEMQANGASTEELEKLTNSYKEAFEGLGAELKENMSFEDFINLSDIDLSNLKLEPKLAYTVTPTTDEVDAMFKNLQRTVTYTVKVVGGSSADLIDAGARANSAHGAFPATGTANAYGTAHLKGTWGSHFGTHKALVGEIGQELMVDPNTGTWRTIGDYGPEIITVPDDAIIFNDQQTKGILAGRGVYGRGTLMHAQGTAHITGGGRIYQLWDQEGKKNKKSGGGGGDNDDDDEDLLSEEYQKDEEMLKHQLNILSDMLNLYHEGSEDWFDQQSNIIDTYSKAVKLSQLEYERLIKEGYDASSKDMRKLAEQIIDWQTEIFDAQQDYWEAQKENATKTLEHLDNHISAVVDLKEAHYDLINSIQDEEIALRKEMQIAKDAYPYLTDAERQAALSDEDYAYLLNKLSKISKEASGMYEDYLAQIEEVGEDASYELDRITEQMQTQYDLKMKEYATAKAELGVLKAKKNLENVMEEKNVATLVGGMWVWEADSENVKQAMEELSDAELEYAKSIREQEQGQDIAQLENYSAEVQAQIDAIDNAIFSMDDLAAAVHDLKDTIWAQILANLSENGKKAVNENDKYYQTYADSAAEALAKLIAENDFTSTMLSAYKSNLGRNWNAAQTAAATLGNTSSTDDHSTTVYIGDVKLDSDTSSVIITALRQANALYQV